MSVVNGMAETKKKSCSVEGVSIELADARLIAAAPELLEALERALRWFDGDFPYGHEDVERGETAAAARAAIEKARGGR